MRRRNSSGPASRSTVTKPVERLDQLVADGPVEQDPMGRQGRGASRRPGRRARGRSPRPDRSRRRGCGRAPRGSAGPSRTDGGRRRSSAARPRGRPAAHAVIGAVGPHERRRPVRSPSPSRPRSSVGTIQQPRGAPRRSQRWHRAGGPSGRDPRRDRRPGRDGVTEQDDRARVQAGGSAGARSGPPWAHRACARAAGRPPPARTAPGGAARARRSRWPLRHPASATSCDGGSGSARRSLRSTPSVRHSATVRAADR